VELKTPAMKNVAFIVEIQIGIDRDTWTPNPEWVRWRADFFHQYTLNSLKNQTFQDFQIFVQCGDRNRQMLESYDWDPAISPCFNWGRNRYEEIDTEYISITRIDSDDLFHKDTLAEIKENLILSDRREVLVFKRWLMWDMLNGFIKKNHIRSSSPFFTHIFPKAIYKNWELFSRFHFCPHGRGGAGDRLGKELSPHKVCIIRHGKNTNKLKYGIKIVPLNTREMEKFKEEYGKDMIDDPNEMFATLKNFGIKRGQIE